MAIVRILWSQQITPVESANPPPATTSRNKRRAARVILPQRVPTGIVYSRDICYPGREADTLNEDNLQTGCLIPLAQSMTSGAIGGAVVFSLALVAGQDPGRAGLIGAAGGALASGLVWWWRLFDWHHGQQLATAYEYNLLADTPEQGDAWPDALRVELSDRENGTHQSIKLVDLPGEPEQLQSLAAGLLAGVSLSQAAWTPQPFSRSEFVRLQSVMLARGLARWTSPGVPQRGASLTPAGRAVFRRLAEVGGE